MINDIQKQFLNELCELLFRKYKLSNSELRLIWGISDSQISYLRHNRMNSISIGNIFQLVATLKPKTPAYSDEVKELVFKYLNA